MSSRVDPARIERLRELAKCDALVRADGRVFIGGVELEQPIVDGSVRVEPGRRHSQLTVTFLVGRVEVEPMRPRLWEEIIGGGSDGQQPR